ncbi:MAG: error-prone DNA polymerase [Verrucomicrobia bacterium]|nr:error-prone DNA polymerase [Verrucomicrobiota bacterium]
MAPSATCAAPGAAVVTGGRRIVPGPAPSGTSPSPAAASTASFAPARPGSSRESTTEPATETQASKPGRRPFPAGFPLSAESSLAVRRLPVPYVELHARSAFSFLRGASTPDALVEAARAQELPAMALLDRDALCGAPRFFGAARDLGLRARVGAEITMADGTVVPLLAATRTGYQNLCQLITETKLTPRKEVPRNEPPPDRKRPCFATWEELARYSEGLIALTGDEEGPVRTAWRTAGPAAAAAALQPLQAIFGRDRLYVELQRHRLRGEEREITFLRDLAAAHRLPLLATGGVNYATPAARAVADAFTCLRLHTTLDAAGRQLSVNSRRHVKSATAMQELFRDLPEAVAESVRLEARLEFTLRDLGYRFPDYPTAPGESMAALLREKTYAGAIARYGALSPTLTAQLDKELELITRLGFCGYFLIVWDICRYARQSGILVQGRGSAANSAVCYALGITAVDPLRHRLLFERFLSEGRVGRDGHPSWPDIDLDLPSGDLRERVIQKIYATYAPRGAAMTANVITYRGRSTVREIGKVLGFGEDALDRFSSLYANGDFPETLELQHQLAMAGIATRHPRAAALHSLYRQVHGLPRHLGQHSGGMVICQGHLDKVVPLENATMPGRVVVQWDKDDCEDLGIVKVDFLGLGMMAALQETFAHCAARGRPVELHTIPPDDPATYAAMQRADTVGVFQIESRAQMASLPRLKPACFYDVAMQVAIVRPGPIVGNLAHPLVRRRQGIEPVTYLDPSVDTIAEPILRRTLGVILFQEQMLELAMKLARFTGGEAEELRRAMGFTKGTERLQRALARLCTALRAEGRNETVVKKVSEAALSFAAYGFPESHALSFALLAYASTWLKVHRPAEFTASLLNHQPMGFYSPATLVQDARRHGLRIRPVCVTASDWDCTVEADDAIRIGLRYVKGLRESSARAMLAARAAAGFTSLHDFLRRTTFSAAELRALAALGALNPFVPHRRAALWQVEAAWSEDEPLFRTTGSGHPLLSTSGPAPDDRAEGDLPPSPLAPMTLPERLRADFSGLELTPGVHPMALLRAQLPDAWRAADLPFARSGTRLTVAGSVICRQRPGTAKGFMFISLEDETGIANIIVIPQLFEARRLVITQEPALRITGRLQNQEGVIHVKAEEIEALADPALTPQASHDFH